MFLTLLVVLVLCVFAFFLMNALRSSRGDEARARPRGGRRRDESYAQPPFQQHETSAALPMAGSVFSSGEAHAAGGQASPAAYGYDYSSAAADSAAGAGWSPASDASSYSGGTDTGGDYSYDAGGGSDSFSGGGDSGFSGGGGDAGGGGAGGSW